MSRTTTSFRQRCRMEMQNWLIGMTIKSHARAQILDLGTEYGHSGRSIRKTFPRCTLVGVEVHEPTFRACAEDSDAVVPSTYDKLHLRDALEFLRENKIMWDVIVAAELIEHLDTGKGFELLDLLKSNSRLAIVTSPLGFMAQGGIYGNPHQEHVSGWEPKDINSKGFKTFAIMPGGYTLGVYYHDTTGKLM